MKTIPAPNAESRQQLKRDCAERFDVPLDDVSIIHAPYRICPLGAHIDHQLGPVSAFATDHGITLAFAPATDNSIEVASRGFDGVIRFKPGASRGPDWADYARGAAMVLAREHRLSRGASILVDGAIAEAGLSSSAAVGLGYLLALASVNEVTLSVEELVELDRQIENDFMGLRNGILDPAAIAFAQPGCLTLIDCESATFETLAQRDPFQFIAVYSGIREPLVASVKFNNRVEECREAASAIRALAGNAPATPGPLGQVPVEDWESHRSDLPDHLRRRADHFFSESARVRAGAICWQASDKRAFGELMQSSGLSSINNYETGCPELIAMFEILNEMRGVYGARFCGAGFRGCCIALIDADERDTVREEVGAAYAARYPQLADVMWSIDSVPANGLSRL